MNCNYFFKKHLYNFYYILSRVFGRPRSPLSSLDTSGLTDFSFRRLLSGERTPCYSVFKFPLNPYRFQFFRTRTIITRFSTIETISKAIFIYLDNEPRKGYPIGEGSFLPLPYSFSWLIKSISALTRFRIAVVRTNFSRVAFLPPFLFLPIGLTSFRLVWLYYTRYIAHIQAVICTNFRSYICA